MQDPTAALTELDRARKLPASGASTWAPTSTAASCPTRPSSRCSSAARPLGLPILLHPLNVNGADRLGNYYLTNFLGNPFDTAIAAAYLVFGGVLDRLPKLQVCLPHAGGACPSWSGA